MKGPKEAMAAMPELDIAVEPADDREAKLALVRKLIFAIQKPDEHAALDALEDLLDEHKPSKPSIDDDDVSALEA